MEFDHMNTEMVWEDPPEPQPSEVLVTRVAQLRQHPGRWALMFTRLPVEGSDGWWPHQLVIDMHAKFPGTHWVKRQVRDDEESDDWVIKFYARWVDVTIVGGTS